MKLVVLLMSKTKTKTIQMYLVEIWKFGPTVLALPPRPRPNFCQNEFVTASLNRNYEIVNAIDL